MNKSHTLQQKFISNTVWNGIERFSALSTQMLCTIILARYLTPEDFGLVGLLFVFTAIGNTFIDAGFGQTLIREKEITKIEYSSIFYFNVIISIILYLCLFCLSEGIAIFYDQPILNDISKVTFLVFVCNAFYVVQYAINVKQLKFKKLCLISISSSVIACVVAILIAYFRKDVWALVFQNLLTYLFRSVFLWIFTDWKPLFYFSLQPVKKYFVFSKNLMLSGLIGNIFNNIYPILIGKYYTISDVGFYSQADRLKNIVTNNMTNVVQNVAYPFFVKISNDNETNLYESYRKVIIVTQIMVGSIMILFMGTGSDLFELLMGDSIWRICGFYLMILGINGILQPLCSLNQNILLVKGKGKSILYIEVIRRILMILILIVTLNYDMETFIWGQVIYTIIVTIISLYVCGKPIGYGTVKQLTDLIPVFVRLFLAFSIISLSNILLQNHSLWLRFTCSLTIGVFMLFILFIQNKYCKMIIRQIKQKKS